MFKRVLKYIYTERIGLMLALVFYYNLPGPTTTTGNEQYHEKEKGEVSHICCKIDLIHSATFG